MAIATKESISLVKAWRYMVKEVFNMRPLDYRVIPYIMKYEMLKPRDTKFENQKFLTSVSTYAEMFFSCLYETLWRILHSNMKKLMNKGIICYDIRHQIFVMNKH